MKRTHLLLAISIYVLVGYLIFDQLLTVPLLVLLGWVNFLAVHLREIKPNWGDVIVGAGFFSIFTLGLHAVGLYCWARGAGAVNPWRFRWTAALVMLLIAMFATSLAAVGLVSHIAWVATSPEPWFVRFGDETTRRNSAFINSRQLAIGAANVESATKKFPPGCYSNGRGRLLHGWMLDLLCFIEEELLYQRIDKHAAWDSPKNAAAFRTDIPVIHSPYYRGPKTDSAGRPLTNYASNVHVMGGERSLTLADIPDGTSHTLLLGEANQVLEAWGSPTNWRDPNEGLSRSPHGFGSDSKRREVVFAFADGHIQALSPKIDPHVLRALATPDGGEAIAPDF